MVPPLSMEEAILKDPLALSPNSSSFWWEHGKMSRGPVTLFLRQEPGGSLCDFPEKEQRIFYKGITLAKKNWGAVLGFELGTLCLLGRQSTTWTTPHIALADFLWKVLCPESILICFVEIFIKESHCPSEIFSKQAGCDVPIKPAPNYVRYSSLSRTMNR
jgi:hypothetical protein